MEHSAAWTAANALQHTGFLVIRISWRELQYEQEKVLVWVASALARRTA